MQNRKKCMKKNYYGRWNIESMEGWDKDYINLVEQAHIHIESDGSGQMIWGAMSSTINGKYNAVLKQYEFSWQGFDEGDRVSGEIQIRLISDREAIASMHMNNGGTSQLLLTRQS